MAYTDEKKDKFYTAINHYAEEQRKRIEDEIDSFREKELSEAEIGVLTECYLMIQKEMAQTRVGIAREMAAKETELKREVLEKRRRITEEVFRRAAEKLKEFTGTERYADFLKKTAGQFASVLREPGTVIFLRPGDESHEEAIRESFGLPCAFQTLETIRIGGILAQNDKLGLSADGTLDALLENQREWFEEQSGLAVV